MKILTISNYYPEHSGGIEFVAKNLVQCWRARHTVRWMACEVKGYTHACVPDDIPIKALNFAEERLGFPYPLPLPKEIFRIHEQVHWCDILHLHDCLYATNQVAFWIGQYYKKPTIITQHVGLVPYKQKYKNFLQSLAYNSIGNAVLRKAAHIVFINSEIKRWFETRFHLNGKTHLIPNGVDRNLFYPADPAEREDARASLGFTKNQIVVLFVGRFTEKKGLHHIKYLAENSPGLSWLLTGGGEIMPEHWKLPNVQVLPPQPQTSLRKFYVSADLLVLPSSGEGFPLVIQEALSCGLPCAVSIETATHLPDAPLLQLPTDRPHHMLETFQQILADIHSLKIRRLLSAEYANRWDWDLTSLLYEDLFRMQF